MSDSKPLPAMNSEANNESFLSLPEIHLFKAEEELLRKKMYSNALRMCRDELNRFAECAGGRTISVIWACRNLNRAMNDCLHPWTSANSWQKCKDEALARKRAEFQEFTQSK